MPVRNTIVALVLAALVGGAVWFSTLNDVDTPAQGSPVEGQGVELTWKTERYTESTYLYSIGISYPSTTNPQIQTRVDEIVAEEILRFKADSVGLIDDIEESRIRAQGRPYELIIEYKAYSDRGLVSFEFDIYLDTGGAHPNSFFRTATFNQQGGELALEDLFLPEAAYLSRLSDEAYSRVLVELGRRVGGEVTSDMADIVRLGTAPSPEALQFFYLEDREIHLLFPPYQVAAYAAGSFDIAIPFSVLRDIVRPEIQ